MGRFLNSDDFASTGQGIIGNNMFAFCGNNPACRVDTNGYFWTTLAAVGIGAVASVAASAISAMICGEEFTVGDAVGAAVEGASTTFMIIVGVPPIIANPLGTALGSIVDEIVDFDKNSFEDGMAEVLEETKQSFVTTAVFGVAGKVLPKYVSGKYLKDGPFDKVLRELIYEPKYLDDSAISTIISESFWDTTKSIFTNLLW